MVLYDFQVGINQIDHELSENSGPETQNLEKRYDLLVIKPNRRSKNNGLQF